MEAAQILRIRDSLVRLYAMLTGRSQEQVAKDLDRDNYM